MNKNWLKKIDSSWTLFLDRDGVLNHDVINDYVRNWNQFHFFDTTLPAMKILAEKFSRIIIITNQRGVGIELMSQKDLDNILYKIHIPTTFETKDKDTLHAILSPSRADFRKLLRMKGMEFEL